MRQDPKELSHQELVKRLRKTRKDLFIIRKTLESDLRSILVPESDNIKEHSSCSKEVIDGIVRTEEAINSARLYLREVLEIADTSGTYPDPPTDIPPDPHPLSSGLERITDLVVNIEDNLKDLIKATAEYYTEGWAVRYHEQAIMSITMAKQQIKFTSAIRDEESTPREEKRVQDSSNSLHNADRGFQASGRAGQH